MIEIPNDIEDVDVQPFLIENGGALDVDSCPPCWERRAHIERYLWATKTIGRMKVLDFGCGAGYGSEILQQAGNIVTGLDKSAEALALAKQRRPEQRFINSIADDEEFDACTVFEVLEHLRDPGGFVRNVKARHLLASTPIVPTVGINPYHIHDFTSTSFMALIEQRFKIRWYWFQTRPFSPSPTYMIVHGEVE